MLLLLIMQTLYKLIGLFIIWYDFFLIQIKNTKKKFWKVFESSEKWQTGRCPMQSSFLQSYQETSIPPSNLPILKHLQV